MGRRPVLVATAALLAGCDAVTGSSPAPTPQGGATAPATGDDALTEEVRTSLARAHALAERVGRFPGLAGFAAPYAALHRAHGTMLGGLPDVDRPRVRRQRARQTLLDREQLLQQELVEAARAAGSGALAQAFAAMAAAVAQRRETTR